MWRAPWDVLTVRGGDAIDEALDQFRLPAERLGAIRAKAAGALGVHVTDMPAAAQATRVYQDYLDQLAGTGDEALNYLAVSIVGPRNRVDEIVLFTPLTEREIDKLLIFTAADVARRRRARVRGCASSARPRPRRPASRSSRCAPRSWSPRSSR